MRTEEPQGSPETRRDLVRRWSQLGQTGDPDPARVAQLRSQATERAARTEPIASSHADLINGLRIWQNDQQLQARGGAIAATIREKGVATEAELTEKLQADVTAAQAQLEVAQRVRDRMEEVGAKMQKPIADEHEKTAHIFCPAMDSRAAVDEVVGKAAAAGGKADIGPTDEQGFMYGRNFTDPDGHDFAPFWMDIEACIHGRTEGSG